MDFLLENWELISTLIMFIVTTFAGTAWVKVKKTLVLLSEAAADDKISAEEVQEMILVWKK